MKVGRKEDRKAYVTRHSPFKSHMEESSTFFWAISQFKSKGID